MQCQLAALRNRPPRGLHEFPRRTRELGKFYLGEFLMNILRTLLSIFSLLFLLTACDSSTTDDISKVFNDGTTLKVIAGSELKDIEPMLATIKEKTGVQLQMEYIGTLDGAEKITAQQEPFDLAWF
ncbi:MAG: hypothetical protein Q8N30_00005 [Methylococcales bacterium]|nr:hypothetical protein [Methylococcales bacterium]